MLIGNFLIESRGERYIVCVHYEVIGCCLNRESVKDVVYYYTYSGCGQNHQERYEKTAGTCELCCRVLLFFP